MAINQGYHSRDKNGNPRGGEKVDELLDKIEDAKIENGTISIGGRSITPITEHQDISGKANVGDSYTKSESDNKYSTKQELNGKQDVIDDLSAIRSGANLGSTAYQKPSTGIPANDIAESVIPVVPTNVSAFTNDAGYLTEHQSLDDYYTKTHVDTALGAKADTAGLADVATSGDYDDLENKPSLFSGNYNDLSNKPTIPAAQVNSDWNATGGVAEILNKPTIPAEQIQSDWEQDDNTEKDFIKNKPDLSVYAPINNPALTGTPTAPTAPSGTDTTQIATTAFVKGEIDNANYAGSQSAGGAANKAVSIPFGQVDSTSTATAFTATVDGITELRDGVCVYLRNGVVSSAAGYTININNLGAKPVYVTMAAATASTTTFNANYTMLFVYNSTRVSGGCWDLFYGYYSDGDTKAYNIYDYAIKKPVKNVLYRYQFLFTCMDGTLLPANSDNNVTAATHVLTKESFNPWGQVYYYGASTTVNAGALPASAALWTQATYNTFPSLQYSFNTASTLVANNDIYIKCIPQPDGSAILADNPIVFALPTYEDGFIYKRLGKAYDTYRIILEQDKPVYYYKDGIKLWTGYNLQEGVMVTDEFTKKDSGVTSDVRVKSVGGKTVVWNQLVVDVNVSAEVYGITRTKVNNTTLHYSGTSTNSTNFTGTSSFGIISGHKYYFSAKGAPSTCKISSAPYPGVFSVIYSANTTVSIWNIGITIPDGTSIDNDVSFKVIDLTQMFGTGNEPSTVEEFERMFPEDSYAYDAGRIVNVAMTGMKSIDADGNDLDSAELDVTTLTGVADGGSTSEIIFPNGMNGIGDVRDEIDLVNGRAVKRIGVVDLDSLTWSYSMHVLNSSTGSAAFHAVLPSNTKRTNTYSKLNNSILEAYTQKLATNFADGSAPDKSYGYYSSTSYIYICDSSYSDATTFATAMSGVMLYYELATPIEYTLDTTPLCAISVVKGGKEMILPYNASEPACAPVRIVEEYKVDYVSNKVVKNLEDRIAALEAIINNG